MKTSIMILLMAFIGLMLHAGDGNMDSNQGKLMVEVDGITSDQGDLKVLLFHSEAGYPTEENRAMYALSIELEGGEALVNFDCIPFHEYALFVYHDENKNGKLDKNWTGVAKEGYGFSNEINGARVMPLFSDSVFDFNADGQVVKIHMVPVNKKGIRLEVSK
ncbi:MAG: DUF2141 domain-containing protein [Bacteroidetes bacterium]|nr:DUF2141 domain-containing protein [Bacteroidota bacterium]